MHQLPKVVRGAVAVEFALLLIPMLVLMLAAAEFGRALYQYNTLVKAVRASARHLSQFDPTDTTTYSIEKNYATCLAVYGNSKCTGQALAPGLTTNMVSFNPVTITTTAGTSIITLRLVEAKISGYTFNFFINLQTLLGSDGKSITFGDIRARMRQS
jgi:Flp pilus assembly protein TadG